MLFFRRPCNLTLAVRSRSSSTVSPIECTRKLAGRPLQHGRDRGSAVCRWNRRCFRHEVEVEELDQLELHLAARFARLENRGDCEETIEVLECAGILRGVDQDADQGDDSGGLDGWAIDWFEEVEEMLYMLVNCKECSFWGTYIHIKLPREQRPGRRMQKHYALDQVQCLDDQQVILLIMALAQQSIQAIGQAHRNIPLEPILQLEELSECRIIDQFPQGLPWWWFSSGVNDRTTLLFLGLGRATRQADLRQKAIDLPQTFADLALVVG